MDRGVNFRKGRAIINIGKINEGPHSLAYTIDNSREYCCCKNTDDKKVVDCYNNGDVTKLAYLLKIKLVILIHLSKNIR